MFKTVLTLFRGTVAVAEEELQDRTALVILDQQMRDAAAAVERSKRALALAIAQDQQEGRRLEATLTRIADLEVRATAALDGGREDLAREAAQAIADQMHLFRHIHQPLAALFPQQSFDEISVMARSLFSAVHGMVALGLEQKLIAVPLALLREQIATMVKAMVSGLVANSAEQRSSP